MTVCSMGACKLIVAELDASCNDSLGITSKDRKHQYKFRKCCQ